MNASNATITEQLQFTGNRLLMRGMKVALGLLPLREPKLLVGTSALDELADMIADRSLQKVLLVTTAGIMRRGQADELIRALELRGVTPVIYDGIRPDPTFAIVNEGLELLRREACDGVVAFGGGSAMDAAKVMAIAATNRRAPEKLVGILKGLRKPLPFYAVPTTAGTGSETTVASVISEDESHAKSFVVDHRTLALGAAFDPRLMEGIGPDLTAATGMDALTHAIEAWISTINTPETDRYALEAPERLWSVLDREPRLRGVTWGHVHQDFEDQRGNVRLFGSPSTVANSIVGRDKFTLDVGGPAWRWLRLQSNGAIETGLLKTG